MWFSKVIVFAVLFLAAYAQSEPGVLQTAVQFLGSCGDKEITTCLKEKAIETLDSATGDVPIVEGLTLKKDETVVEETAPVEEVKLPEEGRARESAIDNILVDRVAKFLTSHTLEFKIPKTDAEEFKRSLEEARKKKKKGGKKMLLPLLLLLKLKAAIILPIILGAIAFIAIKALIVGKIALVLSLVGALKKLLHGKSSGHDSYDIIAHPTPIQAHGAAWPVADEHYHHDAHHGHFRRSMDAQDLAYNAYSTKNQ